MIIDAAPLHRWFGLGLREIALSLLALGFAVAWLMERRGRSNDVETRFPVTQAIDELKAHPTADSVLTGGSYGRYVVEVTAYSSEKAADEAHGGSSPLQYFSGNTSAIIINPETKERLHQERAERRQHPKP